MGSCEIVDSGTSTVFPSANHSGIAPLLFIRWLQYSVNRIFLLLLISLLLFFWVVRPCGENVSVAGFLKTNEINAVVLANCSYILLILLNVDLQFWDIPKLTVYIPHSMSLLLVMILTHYINVKIVIISQLSNQIFASY